MSGEPDALAISVTEAIRMRVKNQGWNSEDEE